VVLVRVELIHDADADAFTRRFDGNESDRMADDLEKRLANPRYRHGLYVG
jgi:hypothetical protein